MALSDQLKSDLTAAMKAGEKDRVGTLRLVLSELQKDAKEGKGDEVAVLRRERKRRQESAKAFRDGGRDDLATAEEAEAVAETGAESPRDMGKVMPVAMGKVAGRADGRRVSTHVKEALQEA